MLGLKSLKRKAVAAFTPTPTVEEIHQAFDTAGEKALKEAKGILDKMSNNAQTEKIELLRSLGFVNSSLVTEYHSKASERSAARSKIEIVERYQQAYPQYKFIFMDQVVELCKKYNLLCAPISMYKGDVPMKNLKEIEAFSVKDEDSYATDSRGSVDRLQFDFSRHSFTKISYIKQEKQKLNTRMVESKMRESRTPMGIDEHRYLQENYNYLKNAYTDVPKFICAPKSDLVITAKDKVEGVFAGVEIKDPIVLHFVNDGFLVVSKWGVEGDDPILTNEKMN